MRQSTYNFCCFALVSDGSPKVPLASLQLIWLQADRNLKCGFKTVKKIFHGIELSLVQSIRPLLCNAVSYIALHN